MLRSNPTTLHFKIWVYFKQTELYLLNIKICQSLVPPCNPWPGTLELQVCIALRVWKGVKFCFRTQDMTVILASFRCQLLTHLFKIWQIPTRSKKYILKISTASITRPSFMSTVRQESAFHILGLWLFELYSYKRELKWVQTLGQKF